MFDIKDFYSFYQYDYHIYKLVTLKQILDNTDKFEKEFLTGAITGFEKVDFQRTIKSEIRQSYYHAIETTFELIFALIPSNGQTNETEVLFKLSTSEWRQNNDRIRKIAEDSDGLEFLEKQIKVHENGKVNDIQISIARFLFYFGIIPGNKSIPKKYLKLIEPSLKAIKLGLKIIAKDFIQRGEYNSYKHGLRIVPALKHFYILNSETQKSILDWDLSDSMTYISLDSKKEEIKFTTTVFDTDRDIKMTLFCSNLISNLILLRKAGLNKFKKDEKVPILFFDEEEVSNVSKSGVSLQNLVYKMTRIKNVQ